MAITAASVGADRIVRSDLGQSLFDDIKAVVSSSVTWKQGDLLSFDTSAHVLKLVAATSDAANFVGIADNYITSGKLVGPYDGLTPVDAAQSGPYAIGPKFGVVASLKLHTGDAFNPGNKVYLSNGDDSQTVTVTDPGDANYIGIFVDAAVASAASGQQAKIKIGARYPSATGTGLNF